MNTEISKKLYQQAVKLMPGGVNSPVRSCKNVGKTPLFIERAEGSKIYDVDGNAYIDYVCSWGPNILGHGRKEIIEAVKKSCDKGLTFGACHQGEIELAEIIKRNVPSMERLRLVNSGTEAVMSAVRAARGYTGRDKIMKFEGCYHGHSDGLLVKAGSGLLTGAIPDSAGVPQGYTENTLLAVYNHEQSVRELFEKFGENIAAVIVEPCAANMGVVPPKKGFLEFLREITKQYGTVLIFDEVITGFRLSLGGAQAYYNVIPDMTTLGKIVGGGMPLAVYGGKKEIMECVSPLGSVYQAGTLSGNPVAVSAGIAVLRLLEENADIYRQIDEKAQRLEKTFRESDMNVNREGSLLTVFFTDQPVLDDFGARSSDREKFANFYSYLLDNGIYSAPSQFEAMFVSAAHSEEDIEYTCRVIRQYSQK